MQLCVCNQCNGWWELLSEVTCTSLCVVRVNVMCDGEVTFCGSRTEGHEPNLWQIYCAISRYIDYCDRPIGNKIGLMTIDFHFMEFFFIIKKEH